MKKSRILNQILSLILSIIMILSLCVSVKAQDISYYDTYKSIKIKGYAPSTEGNPFVTITLKNGDEIIGFGEAKIDAGGRYEYIFKAPKMQNTAVLRVKCAGEDITDTVYEAILETSTFVQVPYTLTEQEDIYKITADLSEIIKYTKQYKIFAAQYNENGNLAGCKTFSSDELENKAVFEQDIDKVGEMKLFVWTSTEQMAKAGSFVEGDGGVLIQFGAKADNQQAEGYKPVSGENGYERFLQVKSELPEELEVVKEQTPQIKNAFYVSCDAVSGDGSLSNPFSTIEEAVEAYRALSDYDRESWTAIYLMSGEYSVAQTIELNNTDTKLFIGAYNDEEVIFTNTKSVAGAMFTEVNEENTDSSVIERIHEDAEQVYYIDYADLGIEAMTDIQYGTGGRKPKLLYNGKEATLSRYPNGGDTYVSNVIDDGYDNDNQEYRDYAVFVPTDSKPFAWKNQTEIGMAGQLSVNWYYYHMQAYFDNELNHVKVPAQQAAAQNNGISDRLVNNSRDRSHFHYFNVFEEMDMPGEWCYSDAEQRVYIYPDGDISSAKLSIRGDMTEYALKLIGTEDVVIDGITFEMYNKAVRAEGCENTVIQNCEFKNTINSVSIYECKNTGVLSSDFRNVYTGVNILGDYANEAELEAEHNFVQNCYFNGVENDCTGMTYSSGNIISHNLAENFKGWFSAVFYGSENIIEYNEAYAGGFNGNEDYIIYLDGHYDARANHVRYNYFHDMTPDQSEIECGLVICMDDLAEEQYVYGNVIQNVNGGIYGNGGDNNVIDGNYIIDCNSSVMSNIWCSISMGNSMYKNISTMGNTLLNDVKTTRHMATYYNLNMANSKWGQRYPHAITRANYLEGVSEAWSTGDTTSEDMLFARLCTGNYITNNVGVNSDEFTVNPSLLTDDMDGDGVADTTDASDMFTQTTNPSDGVTQDGNGNDYNVVWNNTYQDSISLSEISVVEKAGLKREPVYEDTAEINFDYPTSSHTQANVNVWEACWNKPDKVNFFKLIVSADESFTNIVSEKWLLDNRGILTFGNYEDDTTVYYYKVQAFNAGTGESSLTTPIAESEVRSIERYKQQSDVQVISKGNSNLAESWMGTKGNQQIRNEFKGMLTQQTDDGYYVKFTAPAEEYEKTYRMVWDDSYGTVESSTEKYDSDTTTKISFKFRLPSESEFAQYADIGMAQWYPGKFAQDSELGAHANEIKLIAEKADDKYNLYFYDYGRRNPITKNEESRILLKTYTADELFGRWIDAEYTVDMRTGLTTVTADGVSAETDQNDTNWGKNYQWNPESFLRFFDFALKTNADSKFTLDVKDVEVIRAIK